MFIINDLKANRDAMKNHSVSICLLKILIIPLDRRDEDWILIF